MMMHLQMVIWDTAVPHTEPRAAPTHAWVRPSSSRRALNRAAKASRSSLTPVVVAETAGNIASATMDCSLVICFCADCVFENIYNWRWMHLLPHFASQISELPPAIGIAVISDQTYYQKKKSS